ncbi:MAG: Co2+/Mg2+ efflux protein ApaG [Gemmatimonadaceae bacterium]|nr:Co2+/Mg2+ efflux protein ApaG [Gemmatimonadaceae bacterium]
MPAPFFYKLSNGFRITVRPAYLAGQSAPERGQFVFAYFVRIDNVGAQAAQLLSRRWHIHDDVGEDTEVAGDGVVGEQPLIVPGGVHEYQSFCVLKGPDGYMEGEYFFQGADGTRFASEIPRFTLAAGGLTS